MTYAKQTRLTQDQLAQIAIYTQRWQYSAFHPGSVNRYQVKDLLYDFFQSQHKRVPIVHFCTGPLELLRTDAFNRAQIDPENRLWNLLGTPLWQPLVRQLSHPVHQYLRKHLALALEQRLTSQLESKLMKGLSAHLGRCSPRQPLLHHTLATGGWRSHCAWFDYAIHELGCSLDVERWSTLSQLIDCGGWLIPTAEPLIQRVPP